MAQTTRRIRMRSARPRRAGLSRTVTTGVRRRRVTNRRLRNARLYLSNMTNHAHALAALTHLRHLTRRRG